MINRIHYRGWDDCIRLKNHAIELIIPTSIGPRVLHCSTPGGHNIFYEERESDGTQGGEEWHAFGGHRLWHGPQVGLRPNEPDNSNLAVEMLPDGIHLTQETQEKAKLQKQVIVKLTDKGAVIEHILTNKHVWPIKCTAWALTQMKEKGIAILPLPKDDTYYMPNFALTYWPWTKADDERVTRGEDYLLVTHDPENEDWWKIGYGNTRRWAAYIHKNTLFIKKMEYIEGAVYSDYGASCESYADAKFVEIESLSPLVELQPEESIHLIEKWYVVDLPKYDTVPDLINWIEMKLKES